MSQRAINIEVIKSEVAEFLKSVRAGESVQSTVTRMVGYKKADDLVSIWAGEIDAQSIDKDEKNKVLSKFRTQLRRAAEANELDQFPSVKKSGQSYAVVWKDWPEEASDIEQAFNEAVAKFRKLPNAENRKGMDLAAEAYAKAAKDSNASTADKVEPNRPESADLGFDEEHDEDVENLVAAIDKFNTGKVAATA